MLISKCRVSELAVISDVLRKYIDPEQADPVHKQRLGPDIIAHLWDNTIFQKVCLELPCAAKIAHACIAAILLLVMQQPTAVFYPWKGSKSLNFFWLLLTIIFWHVQELHVGFLLQTGKTILLQAKKLHSWVATALYMYVHLAFPSQIIVKSHNFKVKLYSYWAQVNVHVCIVFKQFEELLWNWSSRSLCAFKSGASTCIPTKVQLHRSTSTVM